MTTIAEEILEVEEQLGPDVRHNLVICRACVTKHGVNRPATILVGRFVTTICGRLIRYQITTQWCADCVTIRNDATFVNECSLCGGMVEGLVS